MDEWDALYSLKQALRMYDHICTCIAQYDAQIQRTLTALHPAENRNLKAPDVTNEALAKPRMGTAREAAGPPDSHDGAVFATGRDGGPAVRRGFARASNKNKRKNFRKRGQEPMREAPFRLTGYDLTAIDGIGVETAETVLSELGTDLSCFPSENHFISYLKLAPKLAISGGKPIRIKRTGSTTTRLGATFRMAALALRNSKTALGAEYRRIARRKGASVAVFALARKLAILVYRLLRFGQAYVDEGMHVYEARFKAARIRTCKQIAKKFGLIILQPDKVVA